MLGQKAESTGSGRDRLPPSQRPNSEVKGVNGSDPRDTADFRCMSLNFSTGDRDQLETESSSSGFYGFNGSGAPSVAHAYLAEILSGPGAVPTEVSEGTYPAYPVLVRTDSTMAAAYINRLGDLGSPTLCRVVVKLWVWVQFTESGA